MNLFDVGYTYSIHFQYAGASSSGDIDVLIGHPDYQSESKGIVRHNQIYLLIESASY